CPLGKSRRLRGPGAQHRARRRGVLSLRQVSLHKQRKVARAVTARKLLILMSAEERRVKTRPTRLRRDSWRVKTRPTGLLPATQKSKSSSLRSRPHPALRATFSRKREKGCLTALPQAGEGILDRFSRRREKGCLAALPRAGEGLFDCSPASGRRD